MILGFLFISVNPLTAEPGDYSVGSSREVFNKRKRTRSSFNRIAFLKTGLQIPIPLLVGLVILTIARLVIAGSHELTEDEAYYHMWSERPALSYYSKGPGIAMAMKTSTAIFGHGELGIRFFSPILALGSSLLLFRLARSIFDVRTASWSVLLLNLTPIFNAGSLLMTIDPLSMFFWLAAMLAFWKALHRASSFNVWWPVTGMVIGLGFLCKYTNALQLLSIILLLAASSRWRGQLRKSGLWVMLGCFLVWTLPVIIWNAQNDWVTVTHLKERGSLDESEAIGLNPGEFLAFLGGHLGVYSPIIFIGMLWALTISARQFFKDERQAFLVAFSLPIIAMYFLLSFNEAGQLNWTSPGFIIVGILLAFHWQHCNLNQRAKNWIKGTALALGFALSIIAVDSDIVRRAGIPWSYGIDEALPRKTANEYLKDPLYMLDNASDFSARLRGWKASAAAISEIVSNAAEEFDDGVFLLSNRYQTAAALGYYLDDDLRLIRPDPDYPRVHTLESQSLENQFSFWPRYEKIESREMRDSGLGDGDKFLVEDSAFLGKNAIYITDFQKRMGPPLVIQETFSDWRSIAVIDILRRGEFVRRLKIFACYNYTGRDV